MLLFKCVKIFLIIFSLNICGAKSEEVLNNTSIDPVTNFSTSTEADLNFKGIESFPTTSKSFESKKTDFISKTLENIPTAPTNLEETSDLSFSKNFQDLKDIETTPSWELIYPEKNVTTQEPGLSISSTTTLSTNTTTESSEIILPKYFKVDDIENCQKFFGQCLRQVLARVVPKLKNGNKLHDINPLDPIYFNATAFQYNSGPFNGFITIRYALVYGLTTMKFKKVDFHKQADQFKARLNIAIPKMTVTGSYKGDMLVNNVKVRPRGDFNISIKALDVDLLSLGEIFRKDDHIFLKFTKSNATTSLKDSKVNATGIFPDRRLNDIVVNVANQYSRDLFNVVLSETRNSWLPVVLNVLNAALAMVPFDFFKMES